MSDQETSIPTSSNVLRYRTRAIEITKESPLAGDKLKRGEFIDGARSLLKSIREPFVIALNAPWGTGKTTTVQMLRQLLENDGVTCVYFNAWKVDYVTDPLVPLVSELRDRLLSLNGVEWLKDSDLKKAKKLVTAVAKQGAATAIKVITGGLINEDELSKIGNVGREALEDGATVVTKDVIDAFKKESKALDELRATVEKIIKHVRASAPAEEAAKADSPPVVFFIDELDRCRPSFAIEMLERIKHIFDVHGLVFVLSMDMTQLKASTAKVYGQGIDATEYLRRFIDLELGLPVATLHSFVESNLENCASNFFKARTSQQTFADERKQLVNLLVAYATLFGMSLRTVERFLTRLILVLGQSKANEFLEPFTLATMLVLRVNNEDLMRQFIGKIASAKDVMEYFRSVAPRGEEFHHSHLGMLVETELLQLHEGEPYVQATYKAYEVAAESGLANKVKERAEMMIRIRSSVNSNRIFRGKWIDINAIVKKIDLLFINSNEVTLMID